MRRDPPDIFEDRRCRAMSKASGERCKRRAHPGTTVCVMHGAGAPAVKAKAAQRVAQEEARKVLRTLRDLEQTEPITDAFSALESLAGEAVALVEVLRGKVAELKDVRYSSSMGLEQLRAELSVYLQSLGRAESILANIAKLGLDERRVRLREAQVAAIVVAFDRVLGGPELNLDATQQRKARELLAGALGAPKVLDVANVQLRA